MELSRVTWFKRLPALFEIPAPDPARALRRIVLMERTVMLPTRIFFVALIFHSFKFSPWAGQILSALDVTVEAVQLFFGVYIAAAALLAVPLFFLRQLPLAALQWTAFTIALADALLLAAMTLITGGTDSILFWLFLGLIVRNAVSVPPGFSQIALNAMTIVCFGAVGIADWAVTTNMDDTTSQALTLIPGSEIGEPLVLRLLVLVLAGVSCYGVQAFLERQRMATEEAIEFASRESQLQSAGRMAAEFAHQLKNPLAVIRNTAYSLRRSVRNKNPEAADSQIDIIQEEVAHADQAITQIMGYARLSEGRVERLDVVECVNRAVEQVFPAAVPTAIKVRKKLAAPFPPLLMQSGHVAEILTNLLQNAQEVLGGRGNILIEAECRKDLAVVLAVADDGPGIPPDKLERIFEAYYTTKEKGTGLGLAIVKHNVELYGGSVSVDSALGKGAKFTVIFPAKNVPKPFLK